MLRASVIISSELGEVKKRKLILQYYNKKYENVMKLINIKKYNNLLWTELFAF